MPKRPRHIAALFSALRFRDPRPDSLEALSEPEWHQLLAFSDRAHLTLTLAKLCHDFLPEPVQWRVDRNLADNSEHAFRLQDAYSEMAEALRSAGAEHLVLKGFAQWPHFVSDLNLRQQSDIDLFCPPDSLPLAHASLLKIGYEPASVPLPDTDDHLPALVRHTGWQWRGNAFDPEMPPSIELHHTLWDASWARCGPSEWGAFWNRRTYHGVGSLRFPALHPLDSFGYCSLHALKHLLTGGLLPYHIYELGFFLHNHAEDDPLWKAWLTWHDEKLRALAAIPAALAGEWFACRLPEAVAAEIASLPGIVPRWFRKFADLPPGDLFRPNKDALWLHLGLIDSPGAKASVFLRRLVPLRIPRIKHRWSLEGAGGDSGIRRWRFARYVKYARWIATRTVEHLRLLLPTLWHGLRFWTN